MKQPELSGIADESVNRQTASEIYLAVQTKFEHMQIL